MAAATVCTAAQGRLAASRPAAPTHRFAMYTGMRATPGLRAGLRAEAARTVAARSSTCVPRAARRQAVIEARCVDRQSVVRVLRRVAAPVCRRRPRRRRCRGQALPLPAPPRSAERRQPLTAMLRSP